MGIERLSQFRAGFVLSLCLAFCGLLLWGTLTVATEGKGGSSSSGFTIGSYKEVGKKIHRRKNLFEHTYRASLTSTAAVDAYRVSARLVSRDSRIVVIDGDLAFGHVPAGATVVSRDTFTIQKPANVKFRPSLLEWRFGHDLRPVAEAGPDQTAPVGTTVYLDGSTSSDGDGDPLTFRWTFTEKPNGSTAILSDRTAVNPTFTIDKPGTYTVQLVVDDGQLASVPDTVTVSTVNSAPVANAGPDQTAPVGTTVRLDGSASSDVDGDPLSYQWTLTLAPDGSAAHLSDPNSATPAFTLDRPGYYSAQLVVDDGLASSEPDFVSIATLNSKPVAEAGPDQSVYVGDAVTLNGSGSTDLDGDRLTYRWALINQPEGSAAALSDSAAIQPVFAVDRPGAYVVQLIVNDGSADSDPDTVVITTLNSRPIAAAGPDQGVPVGTLVQLDGAGSLDADGDVLSYHWSLTSVPEGSAAALAASDSATPAFTVDRPGSYVAQLIVRDGQLDSYPDTVTVSTVNSRPVADAGPDQSALAGTTIHLNGAGSSDPDGGPLSYQWALVSTPDGSQAVLSDPLTSTTTFLADRPGDYVAQLIVHDGQLASDPDTALIQVALPPNVLPAITSAPLTAATVGQSYVYDVDATDADGDVLVFSLATAPAGMSLDVATGVIQWTPTAEGTFAVTVTVSDGRGGTASQSFKIVVSGGSSGNLPPDPAQVAPPLDPTVATPVADATKFLYTGPNPIQTGVTEGTIEPKRAAVFRGTVRDKANAPLPGVTVTVKDHPEFGQTLSRADGQFDLAVNGGGLLTLDYAKPGFLPAQRQLDVPWQDFAVSEDVVLIPLDPEVSAIDLADTTQPFQVAQGSVMSDADGSRQATVLFPQGTQAVLTLPDGTQQPLSTLHVRATEYTVGENGPKTMPGPLPPTSGYTYAVELSADEAIAVGAKTVSFNQPVPVYIDNFLNFPVGEIVPAGWYDRDKAAWMPSDNGKVIKILSIADSLASLDTNGDTLEDDAATLAALGITDAERARLAQLYPVGKSLWRVAVTHFTPWDFNWPYGPPADATAPPAPDETKNKTPPDKDSDDCTGCSINPQAQTVGEELPITGTPYTLHYRSQRALGYKPNKVIDISLAGASVPASLKSIELAVYVAGRTFTQTFPAAPNQSYRFEWDGLDAYGRAVTGSRQATVTLLYRYDIVYYAARPDFKQSFAFASASTGTGSAAQIVGQRGATTITAQRTWSMQLTGNGLGAQSVGEWSLDIHHAYDATSWILWLGTGQRQDTQEIGIDHVISTIAGTGETGYTSDGIPAVRTILYTPSGVASAPDGSIYIADTDYNRIRRIGPDGIITTIAGTGAPGSPVFGGQLAKNAKLNHPNDIAIGADGSVYVAATENHSVYHILPNGIIYRFAGLGYASISVENQPASLSGLRSPRDVAIGHDGSIYVADTGNNRICRVGPDGLMRTFAQSVTSPSGIAIGHDGSVFVADTGNNRIRRIGPDGINTTVAGTGALGYGGDGGLATQARLSGPRDLVVTNDGSIYVADTGNNRIRRIGPDGIITTVAGTGALGYGGDGGLATQSHLSGPRGIAMAPNGKLYIADTDNGRIRQLAPPFPDAGLENMLIPSTDGNELYYFDSKGRHLKTENALTRAVLYRFGYDSAGRLISVTDVDGNVTTIERDAAGNPTAIVAPDGQRTALTQDANGYLATVVNPAGETHAMSYTADGLLTGFTAPKGNTNTFTYDDRGRLIQDVNAGGGGWMLLRSEGSSGFSTAMTTAEGRTTTFGVEYLATGDRRQLNTYPDGTVLDRLFQTNGEEIGTAPDGTVTTVLEGPDPRFGMQAPVATSTTVKTPSGLTATVTRNRAATLVDPGNLLSLTTFSETQTVNGRTSRTVFDVLSRIFTATSPVGRTLTTVVNDRGRPVSRQIPGLEPEQFAYDVRGRLQEVILGQGSDARTVHYDYYADGPSQGWLHTVTDPLGRTVSYEYDLAGRVILKTLPDGRSVQFGYDANGNLTSLLPPGQPAHLFDYTPLDLTEHYTPPTVEATDPATRYQYNLDKQLTRITRPGGETVTFAYDAGGRLQTVTAPQGETTYAYAYDAAGRLQNLTAPGSLGLNYAYDGALLTQTAWTGSIAGTVGYAYDTDFRVKTVSVNGSPISFGYDADSLLTSAGALTLTRHAQNGLLTGTALGTVTDSLTYSGFGEVQGYTANVDSSPVFSTGYTRDALGRITQKTETVNGQIDTTVYTYDLAGRLTEVKHNGTVQATYGYDANGNRTHVNGLEVASYDTQDRLTIYNGTAFAYTANGDLKTKTVGGQVTGFTYDVFGNLRQVTLPDGTVIDYLIDGRNRRIGKQVNGTRVQGFLYLDSLRPIAELDGENQVVSRFVYADKSHVPAYLIRGESTYRIISDHLGSPRLVVNTADGTVMQRLDYDAWGQVILDTNPGFQPFGYAGGLYDRDTGLVRFGARDYDPETGRWTTKDPIRFAGGDTNLYGYVLNDPVNWIDSDGQLFQQIAAAVVVIAAGKAIYDFIDAYSEGMRDAERVKKAKRDDDEVMSNILAGKPIPKNYCPNATSDAIKDLTKSAADAALKGAQVPGTYAGGALADPVPTFKDP
ncbi:PKD domain-containing protein [Methylocaldum sp. GT1TLB]|uniref:PKD domain-containing protein n=1 Tax=Methylocaldum sp. GT1TLB TaxID=3438965 RepID=UPI003DA15456